MNDRLSLIQICERTGKELELPGSVMLIHYISVMLMYIHVIIYSLLLLRDDIFETVQKSNYHLLHDSRNSTNVGRSL